MRRHNIILIDALVHELSRLCNDSFTLTDVPVCSLQTVTDKQTPEACTLLHFAGHQCTCAAAQLGSHCQANTWCTQRTADMAGKQGLGAPHPLFPAAPCSVSISRRSSV